MKLQKISDVLPCIDELPHRHIHVDMPLKLMSFGEAMPAGCLHTYRVCEEYPKELVAQRGFDHMRTETCITSCAKPQITC